MTETTTENAKVRMSAIARGYIDCALWLGCGVTESGDEDNDIWVNDLAPETLRALIADADVFAEANRDDLDEASNIRGKDDSWMGHDLWLTRNRHGAGFWDRGLGEVGDRLTRAAHALGECNLYRGDDGLVYHQ